MIPMGSEVCWYFISVPLQAFKCVCVRVITLSGECVIVCVFKARG